MNEQNNISVASDEEEFVTKIIETEEVVGNPDGIRRLKRRNAVDVFNDLVQALKAEDLLPDEYFLLNSHFDNEKTEFPDFSRMSCYAEWGGSEGIYLNVNVWFRQDDGTYAEKNFVSGKTLAEDEDAFDRMQYIAGYIYKLFCGFHQTPARYLLIRNQEKDFRTRVLDRVTREYFRYLKELLVHKRTDPIAASRDIGLRSMILAELPNCIVSDDKAQQLLRKKNALDFLTKICGHIAEADSFEINDTISSCWSFDEKTTE